MTLEEIKTTYDKIWSRINKRMENGLDYEEMADLYSCQFERLANLFEKLLGVAETK